MIFVQRGKVNSVSERTSTALITKCLYEISYWFHKKPLTSLFTLLFPVKQLLVILLHNV